EGEIRAALDTEAGHLQRRRDRPEDELKARRNVRQFGPGNERQGYSVVQAAMAEHDGSAAGEAPHDVDAVHATRVDDYVFRNHSVTPYDSDGAIDVPAPVQRYGRAAFDRH